MREPNQNMFNKVLQAFGEDVEVGSGELFAVAIRFIDEGSVDMARALLAHCFDMHEEVAPDAYLNGEKTYTEVYLETFRRAFYDEETAALHGMHYVATSSALLGGVTAFLLERALSDTGAEESTVIQFPGSKRVN